MARTHRRHLSENKRAKAAGSLRKERERDPKPTTKTHKQQRPNERARLRKEYL